MTNHVGIRLTNIFFSGCALHDHKAQDSKISQPQISSSDLNDRLQRFVYLLTHLYINELILHQVQILAERGKW